MLKSVDDARKRAIALHLIVADFAFVAFDHIIPYNVTDLAMRFSHRLGYIVHRPAPLSLSLIPQLVGLGVKDVGAFS